MRSNYASTLVTSVANAHLRHFYTKNYAAHMAFGGFYESLQGLADSYIEEILEYTVRLNLLTNLSTIRD